MTSDPSQKDIHEINLKIDDMDKSVGLLLRARRDEVIDELMKHCFRNSIEKVRIFLSIDGILSVSDIARELGILSNNVSRHVTDLVENDLIKLKGTAGASKVYEKTSQVRRLRLEKYLIDRFRQELEVNSANVNQNGSKSAPVIKST